MSAGQQGGVTHSAHGWGQVFPAQLEERQGVVAGHILDVGTEALGSCGRNKNNFTTGGWGLVWHHGLVFDWLVVFGGSG